jgi:hypothetical protein
MSDAERQEMIAELVINTGWDEEYFKRQTDEKLIQIFKERVRR